MFESLFDSVATITEVDSIFWMITSAFLSGIIISLTYMRTYKNGKYSENFALTMILLPAVISMIIMLIGSDIARAFSLAGAFSIIRFRSAPGEPKDIAYVLFSMGAGLASGVGAYAYSVLFTIILCTVMYLLEHSKFASKKDVQKQLIITIPEDLDYDSELPEVFHQYHINYTLAKVKTTSLGSLYKLYYEVTYQQDLNVKSFLDDLRIKNSNLDISLIMIQEESY